MLDLNKSEEEILKYWSEHDILNKTRQKSKGKKPFYFLDGPPFVSGDLHPGQMWVKSMKDVILRYRRFRGFDVYDRAGYDVHGLPIEKRAEAQLGITSKKEIETKIGVEKFIQTCKDYVEAYIGRMDNDFRRFGISLDFSNPYIPSRMQYMESAWGCLKAISEKGLLYTDRKSTTFCTSCGTSVSQGSVEIEYRDDNDPSIFVAFKVRDASSKQKVEIGKDLNLLVWTTTPWTLPANMAVAAHPKEMYVIAKMGNRRFVLVKSRLDAVSALLNESAVVESEFYGSGLEGLQYAAPLEGKVPKQKEFNKYHRVLLAPEMVSATEGSGLVHIAPGHGLEDYLLGRKNKFPIFSPVDEQGLYTEEAGEYRGLKVPAEANKRVLEDLKALGILVNNGSVTHSYPHCWRCDTKLIFIATEQWFINIQKVKKKILKQNSKVAWHPAEATRWQEDVLKSSPDWAISRQRYWGVPIPIWKCDCGNAMVIGSVAELKQHAVNKDYVDTLKDLHKPYIDNVILKCDKCGSDVKRIKDVLDVWFDSSIAYRASLTDEQFKLLFPIDFVLEGVDQLRGWFSYQLKMGTMINGRRPFNNIIIDGMMLGEDGREMHKKLGNYVPLNDILKTSTADAFRLWCTSHTSHLDITFSMNKIGDANKAVIMLYNISNLIDEYSGAVGHTPKRIKRPSSLEKLSKEDAWIVSRLNSTIEKATHSLENYEIADAVNAVRSFLVMDLSRFYLKIAKKRILYSDKKGSKSTLSVLNYVFYNTLLLMAPITPFASEKIYLDRYAFDESIFLESWPASREKLISPYLEASFDVAVNAITAILSSREKENLKLRWPLAKATVEVNGDDAYDALGKLAYVIEDYTNIKKLEIKKVGRANAEIRPAFAKIGPDFKDMAGAVAAALKAANARELMDSIARSGEYSLHTDKGVVTVNQAHFMIIEKFERADAVSFRHGVAYVDKEISRELQDEALLREFERRVQLARKEVGLKKGDKIALVYRISEELNEVVEKHAGQVRSDVNAKSMKRVEQVSATFVKEFELEDEKILIGIEKV